MTRGLFRMTVATFPIRQKRRTFIINTEISFMYTDTAQSFRTRHAVSLRNTIDGFPRHNPVPSVEKSKKRKATVYPRPYIKLILTQRGGRNLFFTALSGVPWPLALGPRPFKLKVLELLASAWMTELSESLCFNLSDSFSCNVESLANLFKSLRCAVLETETES